MSNSISFDAAMQRIFREYLDKNDIIDEVEYLTCRLDKEADKEHVAILDTIKMAMLEQLP